MKNRVQYEEIRKGEKIEREERQEMGIFVTFLIL